MISIDILIFTLVWKEGYKWLISERKNIDIYRLICFKNDVTWIDVHISLHCQDNKEKYIDYILFISKNIDILTFFFHLYTKVFNSYDINYGRNMNYKLFISKRKNIDILSLHMTQKIYFVDRGPHWIKFLR